eukprot:9398494-Ditylum_brightwellii.AAC.1
MKQKYVGDVVHRHGTADSVEQCTGKDDSAWDIESKAKKSLEEKGGSDRMLRACRDKGVKG